MNQYYIRSFFYPDFKTMIAMLPKYFSHFCKYPTSLLPNIAGIYTLKYKSQKYYFMIISVVLPPEKTIHKTFYVLVNDAYSPSDFP